MSNFYELLKDILDEKQKTYQDLENSGIICKRTFYQFKSFTPHISTIIKIANYLEVSLDYIGDRTSHNNFKKYNETQFNFYKKLINLLKYSNISQSKLCRDINLGRSNFTYWKNGSLPKFSTLIDIANYLQCSIDDLLELK